MKKFEILEHISDFKIKAFGKNKKELFLNAMLGMQSALRPKIKNLPCTEPKVLVRGQKSPKDPALFQKCGATGQVKIKKEIKIKSNDLTLLLVDFLSEINYLNEVYKEVYSDIKFIKFSNTELEGEIFGNKVERFCLIIKGVTYHNLDIHQRKDRIWQATILFDI